MLRRKSSELENTSDTPRPSPGTKLLGHSILITTFSELKSYTIILYGLNLRSRNERIFQRHWQLQGNFIFVKKT